ncbi:MAG: oxidoreductase [Opitutus sp.]|nr:oxidoreductase [Opitutus sp.]
MIETSSTSSGATLTAARPVSPVPPRLGFAGVGWIGRNRLEAIAHAQAGEVAAVFDPVVEAAAGIQRTWPDVQCVGNFDELLALPLDGIVIATPNMLHAEQTIAALRSGKAVFCQKPLARTGRETRDVVAAARAADRLLHVDLSYRFHTGMQRIRDLVASGRLGRIYAVEACFHNAYGPDKPWFYDSRLSGGGCLLDLGIHLIDLALWCLDFPSVKSACGHLNCRGALVRRDSGAVEDYAAAQLSLANGASVQLACSWRAPAGCDAQIGVTFFGTEGGASFQNVGGSFYDFRAEHFLPDRSRRLLSEPPDAWGGRAAVAWARQLADDAGFDPQIAQLSAVAETIDRIYGRSA